MANKLVTYILESKEELKKVTWPSRKQVTRDTLVVIGISAGLAAFFWLIDIGMLAGFRKFLNI
jgi:preprotein translocase subunit SecE